MIVVIQCAARKQRHAGHLRTLGNRNVMFVAQPDSVPSDGSRVYARPDDVSDREDTWRTVLEQYNAARRAAISRPGDSTGTRHTRCWPSASVPNAFMSYRPAGG